MSGTNILQCKTGKKAITSKLGNADLRFFCNVHLLNEIYLPTKFLVDTNCDPGQCSKCKNEQRTITPKLGLAK
jgi:hypothetical protein